MWWRALVRHGVPGSRVHARILRGALARRRF
jgi:hypothetical protein